MLTPNKCNESSCSRPATYTGLCTYHDNLEDIGSRAIARGLIALKC